MSAETVILRAYAQASQCRYDEAERELKSEPEALETPHGIDLYARILLASGQRSSAFRLWEELNRRCPDFEPAAKALSAGENALEFECGRFVLMSRRSLYAILALFAVSIGVALSIGRFCGSSVEQHPIQSAVIDETVLHGRFGGAELRALKYGILTNLTEGTVLVIRGGSGRWITDRQRKLAVVADCIKEISGVPVSKMYFQPAEDSIDDVTLQIVTDYSKPEGQSK